MSIQPFSVHVQVLTVTVVWTPNLKIELQQNFLSHLKV